MSATPWTLPEQFDEYRLIRMVGRGNMGVVFLGHDLVLDRPVAIKFLNNVDADARARERFLTEARAAARIHHPNVMAIYRVGELEGRLYIISEYIRGVSLHELKRPIPWREALRLGVGLARGLACAHRQGVLHRDIKLANAMRSESGEVKLLDFSLAKLQAAADPAGPRAGGPELDRAGDPEPGAGLPRVTIDAGTRAGRTVDSTLTRVPGVAPSKPEGDLDSTLTRVDAPADVQTRPRLDLSDDAVVGTPYYMAPELWRAEPASRTSDVYALGVLLYLLCSGQPPIDGKSAIELARKAQEVAPTPLHSLVPGLDRRFGEIVDRCLKFSPRDRYASGDELCTALEMLEVEGAAAASGVKGNPYRGLQAFEARHRNVFFGRGAEIRAAVDRLRGEPFLLVAGDSGVGKSSLCRAGVLPVFCEQASDGRAWATISVMPGRRPLQTLASALANHAGIKEDLLRELFETDPAEILRTLARRHGKDHGLVLFVDQLEEMVTLAEPHQVPLVGRFLAELASGVPGLRLLATARGDFLTRVAALPEVGRYINLAIYLLTPLTREGVREAIVGPARLQEVEFESDALVETLATAGVEGNLPLLQFALAELWEARDPATRKISSADLERIGRVTGALARHADNVVAELPAGLRGAVRRLLMRLVTIEDTRASLPLADLVLGDPNNETALEALVRGRLVVAREAQDGTVYEIAHEALIRNWGTLQRWITEEREARETYHRLETAALEWQRLGSARVGLWTSAQLAETSRIDAASLRPRERAFLAASRAHELRLRRLRVIVAVSVPVILGLVYVGVRVQDARALERRVLAELDAAAGVLAEARVRREAAEAARASAFARFDARDTADGEALWDEALTALEQSDALFRRAARSLETTLSLDPNHPVAQGTMADLLLERAEVAERLGKPEVAAELVERLKLFDDGSRIARWTAPAHLVVTPTPPSARVTLAAYVDDPSGRKTLAEARELGPPPAELPAGSYLLRLTAEAHEEVLLPVYLTRAESLALEVMLPARGSLPPGFVYIPPGRFLFGSDDSERMREKFFLTVPMHQVTTEGYIIARHETTYAEWLAFLNDLPPAERKQYTLGGATENFFFGVELVEGPPGEWRLAVTSGDRKHTYAAGEPLTYPGRARNASHDWSKLPVSGIRWTDGLAYTRWLDRTGRVPGARFCSEWEWERAIRGADGRDYPHGDVLAPTDANYDLTYGKDSALMGPDEVGTHPASRSPLGVDDGVGNIYEWTSSSLVRDERVIRGGAFFFEEFAGHASNRFVPDPETREGTLGLRVCAPWHVHN